ncbi:MAG: hypothetical protein HEP71_33890 [Roseivirga sp.]|nr:hypothetical protein [Roseivirga sp.]
MRKASPKDEPLVIQVISESFRDNPSVLSVIKNDHKREKRIQALARYAFKTGLPRKGVWISSDEQAVAICYAKNRHKENIRDLRNQLVFAIKGIGLNRVLAVMKREAQMNKRRPQHHDYMYFWFFGVSNTGKGQGGTRELKEAIFQEADSHHLPILVETSVEKNKRVYERYGFTTYSTWHNKEENLTLWFMQRPVTSGAKPVLE